MHIDTRNRGKKGNTPKRILHSAGFSLVELLLVISIFVVITTIGLVGFSTFNSQTLLTNLAYDIALSIREAQFYTLSTRGVGGQFEHGHGVYFEQSMPDAYILFRDSSVENEKYDGDNSCTNECTERIELRGYTIADVCADNGADCWSDNDFSRFDIAFKRPDPDAFLSSGGNNYGDVTITVQASNGTTRTISVFTTGQISVGQ